MDRLTRARELLPPPEVRANRDAWRRLPEGVWIHVGDIPEYSASVAQVKRRAREGEEAG